MLNLDVLDTCLSVNWVVLIEVGSQIQASDLTVLF